jgi:hypothetical protein
VAGVRLRTGQGAGGFSGHASAERAASTTAAASAPAAAAAAQPIVEVSRVGFLHEPQFIASGIDLARHFAGDGARKDKNGFYPEFSNMMSGAGFISAGPGYRHTVFGDKAFVDTSAAVSWHFYKMAQARLEFPDLSDGHLTVGAQTMYEDNTQVNYFGIGEDATQDDQTQYRLRGTEIGSYATARASWFSVGAEVGWLNRPKISSAAGTFNPDYPDARVIYPDDPAMNLVKQPNFIRSELSVMADTIDAHSYPTRGNLYRAAATSYADRSGSAFSFGQYEAEGLRWCRSATAWCSVCTRGLSIPMSHRTIKRPFTCCRRSAATTPCAPTAAFSSMT